VAGIVDPGHGLHAKSDGPSGLQKNCGMLAGLNRDFRFSRQKHICAAAKRRRRADVTENQNSKSNSYEKANQSQH
jgi:hypothetical protein